MEVYFNMMKGKAHFDHLHNGLFTLCRPANPPGFSGIIPEISLNSRSPGILLHNPGFFYVALIALRDGRQGPSGGS